MMVYITTDHRDLVLTVFFGGGGLDTPYVQRRVRGLTNTTMISLSRPLTEHIMKCADNSAHTSKEFHRRGAFGGGGVGF
jgi:hypothetical protein